MPTKFPTKLPTKKGRSTPPPRLEKVQAPIAGGEACATTDTFTYRTVGGLHFGSPHPGPLPRGAGRYPQVLLLDTGAVLSPREDRCLAIPKGPCESHWVPLIRG